jgi:hypothetical protein
VTTVDGKRVDKANMCKDAFYMAISGDGFWLLVSCSFYYFS